MSILEQARLARNRGDLPAARILFEQALAGAEGDADPIRVDLAGTLMESSEGEAALRLLDSCRPETARLPAALLVRGGALRSGGRVEEARRVYEEALAGARESGDPERALTASVMIGLIENQAGESAAAVARFRSVLEEATAGGMGRVRVLTLLSLSMGLLLAGAHSDAEVYGKEALEGSRALGHARYQAIALRTLSVLSTVAGESRRARDLGLSAIEAAERSGDPLVLGQALLSLAQARLALGEKAEAEADLRRCVALARDRREQGLLCVSLGALGDALLAAGDAPGSAVAAGEALEIARRILDRRNEEGLHGLMARIFEARGDFASALAAERERARVAGEIAATASAARLDRHRAELEAERLREERLAAENAYLREQVTTFSGREEMIGRSPALRRVLHQVVQVAPTDASVLVLGETGVGKELVAGMLHRKSRRSGGPFITVNCAALPETLIESELFGHEKGAFTGAHGGRIGRFELADGGTIFLDEIGDLPAGLQAKLLRVLQEGEFERLGDSRTRRTDARVVAATNRDLSSAVREGKFRSDLYYRIAVFEIAVPPLRERREDVPLLVAWFTAKYAAEVGKRIDRIPEKAVSALSAYDWPGNVRELGSVIQRAVILSPGGTLVLDEAFGRPAFPADGDSLEGVERAHILGVLAACGWRIKGKGNAAERLGVPPSTLRSRMAVLGIRRA